MRETKLFTHYPPSHILEHPAVSISIPSAASASGSASSDDSQSSWAGLTHQFIAWHVEKRTTIVLEHIVTGLSLRIVFTSPICTRPLFLSSPSHHFITLIVACHTDVTASTLLSIHISPTLEQLDSSSSSSASSHVLEQLRQFIPAATVTAIHPDVPNAIVALSDGRCVRFMLEQSAQPPLLPFSKDRLRSPSALTARALTGRTPASRSSSASLFQQSRAPISSFVSRLFTPRAADRSNLPGHPASLSHDTLPPNTTGVSDPILAITTIDDFNNHRLVASLHASGNICLYQLQSDNYVFQTEFALPLKLSTSAVQHFLLAAPNASLLAIIMADEHPKADSLHVLQLSITSSFDSPITLSCTNLVRRDGPIPPLIAAAFFAEDVIVATRAGDVTALINVPAYITGPEGISIPVDSYTNVARQADGVMGPMETQPVSSRGLPTHTLWTALDDVDAPFGLGRCIDSLSDDERMLLVQAHRFTPQAVARALRLPDAMSATREYVLDALASIELDEEDNALQRVKTRAEQFTKHDDLKVRDLLWDDNVGLIICRERSINVLRPLTDYEKRIHPYHDSLLSCDQLTPKGPVAWLLASHAVSQVLSAQYVDAMKDNTTTGTLNFMLRLVTNFSEIYPELPLTDVLCLRQAESCAAESNEDESFIEVLQQCKRDMVQPGTYLLNLLLAANEMSMLGEAAEHCVIELPISSMFANGIVWMVRFHREIGSEAQIDNTAMDMYENTENELMTDDIISGSTMLKKAYGFFGLAAESCSHGSQRDVLCALELAEFLPRKAIAKLDYADDITARQDWQQVVSTSIQPMPDGTQQKDEIRLGDCAFWLLDRALRLIESYAPKTAASVALKAMQYAPDKSQHERMRSAAFTRFLEAGQLENAHKAILSEPFKEPDGTTVVSKEEAEALRDSIGLFINVTADRNELKWLAEQDLPEPLKTLCGQALERRARGANAVDFSAIAKRFLDYKNRAENMNEEEVKIRDATDTRVYEDLFAWYILREDYCSAAQCASEFVERTATEGLEQIREVVDRISNDQGIADEIELYITLFLEWVEVKREALGYMQSAILLLPENSQFVARSQLSLAETVAQQRLNEWEEGSIRDKVVVDASWVSRRLLLSQAQKIYLTDMVMQHRSGDSGVLNVEHLSAGPVPLLSDGRNGVEWICSILRKSGVTYERMLLCAELGCAWREEIGDACLREVVNDSARTAIRQDMEKQTKRRREKREFGVTELQRILSYVNGICHREKMGRLNWNLVALEQTLLACAGRAKCPHWLVRAAAHGTTDKTGKLSGGDILGVTKILLGNSRPVEAARVLMESIDIADKALMNGSKKSYVSYHAIDATLRMLTPIMEDYPDAEDYHRGLTNKLEGHLKLVETMCVNRREGKTNDGFGGNYEHDDEDDHDIEAHERDELEEQNRDDDMSNGMEDVIELE